MRVGRPASNEQVICIKPLCGLNPTGNRKLKLFFPNQIHKAVGLLFYITIYHFSFSLIIVVLLTNFPMKVFFHQK